MKHIHKVAFPGPGRMGARSGALFATGGAPPLLRDILPPEPPQTAPARNKIATAGLDGAVKSKPAAFFEASLSRLHTVGNFDADLQRLAPVVWFIGGAVQNLKIQRPAIITATPIRTSRRDRLPNTRRLP